MMRRIFLLPLIPSSATKSAFPTISHGDTVTFHLETGEVSMERTFAVFQFQSDAPSYPYFGQDYVMNI